MAVKRQKRKAAKANRRATQPWLPCAAQKFPRARPLRLPFQRTPCETGRESDTAQFIRRESSSYDGDTAIKLYLRESGR